MEDGAGELLLARLLPHDEWHVILLCQEFLTVEVDGQNTLVWGDALVDLDDSFTRCGCGRGSMCSM